MKLIGAGLPRTGTLSQKVALEMLGLGPCYHMVNVLGDLSQAARWRQVFDGSLPAAEVLEGHPVTVDWPAGPYYEQLLEAYPDAKVLLSARAPDTWAKSMGDTVQHVKHSTGLHGHMSAARACIDPAWREFQLMIGELWQLSGLPEEADLTPASLAAAFERYNDEVKKNVPADRLLVWSAAEGWDPLCAFLELPMPDGPFPHVNDSKEFGERIVDGALATIQQHRAAA